MRYEDEINVYGTGFFALKFIVSNPNLKVRCFIEGKKDLTEYLCLPVVKTENANNDLHNRYTVVACSEAVYPEIKRTLEVDYRLEEYENF